jgi:hypothetical protein
MRSKFLLTASVIAVTTGLSAVSAQAQQLVAPVVTNQSYQASYSAWDGFYVGAQGSPGPRAAAG